MGTERKQRAERTGVKSASETSIEISFTYEGVRCRERLKLKPTPANLKKAEQHRTAILEAIYRGTFDYTYTFPESKNAIKFAKTQGDVISLSQYLQSWLSKRKNYLKTSTYDGYRKIVLNTLIPNLGQIRLSELRRKHVKEWVDTQSAGSKRIKNILSVLRKALIDAQDDDLIEVNPLYGWNYTPADKLKKENDVDPFDQVEQGAILENCPNNAFKNLFQFAFWTGLRTSELVGLDWSDIDFVNKRVFVSKAITRASRGQAETTKTSSGTRFVKLLPPALDALNDQKKISFLSYESVFIDPRTNQRLSGDQRIRTVWVSILKKAGVRYRRPYQTRHTFASMMLSAGENPLWVASQMGHSDWTMIAKVYGKWMPSTDQNAGQKALDIFAKKIDINKAEKAG